VRIALTMDEQFYTITKHGATVRIKTGVKNDGRIIAREVETYWNGGAYADIGPRVSQKSGFTSAGPYDIEHIARPNPLVERGEIGSALLGAAVEYRVGTVQARLLGEGEQSFKTPDRTSSFTQLTLNGSIEFPTFASQRLRIDAHAVATAGDTTPRARFAYLGRNGTLPLLELLEQGGDRLVFVDSRYEIPVSVLVLPKLGSPMISPRP